MAKNLILAALAVLASSVSAQKEYNQTCYFSASYDECNQYKGYTCNSNLGRCQCWHSNMNYDETEDRCEAFLGGDCYMLGNNLDWVTVPCQDDNSFCKVESNGNWPWGECTCNDGHIPSEEGEIKPDVQCQPTFNVGCDEDSLPCHGSTGLVCTNGRCQCEHPLSQIYAVEESRCLGAVEAPESCNPDIDGPPQCQENAECGEDRKCHCKDGWSANFGFPRLCSLHHGQACSADGEAKCNEDRGLECLGGTCQCGGEPDVAFDEESQLCAVKQGFACSLPDQPAFVDGKTGSRTFLKCMSGLTCAKNGDDPHFGVCQ